MGRGAHVHRAALRAAAVHVEGSLVVVLVGAQVQVHPMGEEDVLQPRPHLPQLPVNARRSSPRPLVRQGLRRPAPRRRRSRRRWHSTWGGARTQSPAAALPQPCFSPASAPSAHDSGSVGHPWRLGAVDRCQIGLHRKRKWLLCDKTERKHHTPHSHFLGLSHRPFLVGDIYGMGMVGATHGRRYAY